MKKNRLILINFNEFVNPRSNKDIINTFAIDSYKNLIYQLKIFLITKIQIHLSDQIPTFGYSHTQQNGKISSISHLIIGAMRNNYSSKYLIFALQLNDPAAGRTFTQQTILAHSIPHLKE